LLERAERFEAAGAGIVLAANAGAALAALGVDLDGLGQTLAAMELRTRSGRALNRVDLAALGESGLGSAIALPRPVLHGALVAALPPAVRVRLAESVAAPRLNDSGVELDLSDGSHRFDLVVGADGLRSATRAALAEIRRQVVPPLRYSGTTCWRGLVALPEAGDTAVEAWGGRTRVGLVPVGDGAVYYYLVAKAAPGGREPVDLAGLRDLFDGYGGIAGALLAALVEFPPLRHDLFEVDQVDWGVDRLPLLGDAAHGMTPNQGQGAAMAIEDALALAMALGEGVGGALSRYRARRATRVERVRLDSRRLGQLAHLDWPLASAARLAAFRLAPPAAGTAAVRRLVAPGVALARDWQR
jgi:2-polyprenyl-6-methoxyphenol hydroxylase-like FAD-dependent oxidoreductase